jgi:hypothetical protein
MIKWLRYSGVWVTLILNPFHWGLGFYKDKEEVLSAPNMLSYRLQIIFVTIRLVVDDGSW